MNRFAVGGGGGGEVNLPVTVLNNDSSLSSHAYARRHLRSPTTSSPLFRHARFSPAPQDPRGPHHTLRHLRLPPTPTFDIHSFAHHLDILSFPPPPHHPLFHRTTSTSTLSPTTSTSTLSPTPPRRHPLPPPAGRISAAQDLDPPKFSSAEFKKTGEVREAQKWIIKVLNPRPKRQDTPISITRVQDTANLDVRSSFGADE